MADHAPAPWTTRPDDLSGPEPAKQYVRDAKGIIITAVTADPDHPGGRDADARLMAAAPDLLAACELLDLIDRNGIGHVIDVMPAVLAARAAVAKANGGAA